MEPERNDRLEPAMKVNTVQYKVVEDRKTEIRHQMKLGCGEAERKTHALRAEVKIYPKVEAYRDEFIVR